MRADRSQGLREDPAWLLQVHQPASGEGFVAHVEDSASSVATLAYEKLGDSIAAGGVGLSDPSRSRSKCSSASTAFPNARKMVLSRRFSPRYSASSALAFGWPASRNLAMRLSTSARTTLSRNSMCS